MIYPKYGTTFRKIRKQKGFSLSSFENVGISKAALSKFERGLSMMYFESVVRALQEMNISLEEFEHLINDYSPGEKEDLFFLLEKAIFKDDEIQLVQLKERAETLGLTSLSSALISLTEYNSEEITDVLYGIDVWYYSELYLFYLSMESLLSKDILHLLKEFFPNKHPIFRSEKLKPILVKTCLRAVTVLSIRGYKKESLFILEQIEKHSLITTMFHRNLKNMTYGFWKYCFENKAEGDSMMKQGLDILRAVSTPEIFSYYKNRYNYLVKKNQT